VKRFWTRAEACAVDRGYIILLDGKPLKLPGGELALPFAALADAIAGEWAEVAENFTPDDLPLTQLASTSLHRVAAHRASLSAQLIAYGANDLLCYRADAETGLADWQNQAWQPWLDWAERIFGVRLVITSGILPITQPAQAMETFRTRLEVMTDFQIAGLGVIVPPLGSLILGLAVAAGALPPAQACELAHLEELAQEQRWGADAQALARREKILLDVAVTARFMVLCAP
jgi:chaperone required for assembly of F1-ATPase